MSLSCKLRGEPIKFDDKHISERTAKRYHQIQRLTNRMIVQFEEISHNNNNSNKYKHNKGAIYNVTKAVETKSILMQITRAKAANGFHQTNRQGCHINVNNKYLFYNLLHYRGQAKLSKNEISCQEYISKMQINNNNNNN